MQSLLRSFHSLRGTRFQRAPCKGVRFTIYMLTVYLPNDLVIRLHVNSDGTIRTEPVDGRRVKMKKTIGSLINLIEDEHNVYLKKFTNSDDYYCQEIDSDKYFLYTAKDTLENQVVYMHVKRGEKSYTPNQDLEFKLQANDVVSFVTSPD